MESSPFAITPELADGFRRFADTVEEFLRDGKGLVASIPDEDSLMVAIWEQSLEDGIKEDCQAIVSLVNDERFEKETVYLSMNQVDSILRACSAIRLKIYRTYLTSIPDKWLEMGEVQIEHLDTTAQRAYSIYFFLASLQEILLSQLGE